jgi:hypothetical protein
MNRNRLAALAALGVCACASVLDAAGMAKFKTWYADGPGVAANPEVDGMALVRHTGSPGGLTQLTLSLHGLESNQAYSVMVMMDDQCIRNDTNAFGTNSRGDALYHVDFELGAVDLNVTHTYAVLVYVWDGVIVQDPYDVNFGLDDQIVSASETRALSYTVVQPGQ